MIRAKLGRHPGFDSGFDSGEARIKASGKARVFARMMWASPTRHGFAMIFKNCNIHI
jgi:hypothetical protein